MTKTKSTKRALLMSALSLLLCFSMLIGSTFAWFTDSVTSGKNKIVAGNLDVELEYYKNNKWNSVNNATDLFTGDLWEPGHTEVVYLKLSNLGSLALKYQLGINIASETSSISVATDEEFKLSDFIHFSVVGNVNGETAPFADRAEAVAEALKVADGNKKINEGYSNTGYMLAEQAPIYMALVVYMPETVGNEANYKKGAPVPTIELGVNLMATQKDFESDSFGDDYDAGVSVVINDINLLATKTTEMSDFVANLDAGTTVFIESGNYELTKGQIIIDKPLNIVGLGTVNITNKQNGHMFHIRNYGANTVADMTVNISNLNLDGNNKGKAGFLVRNDVKLNLTDVSVKNTGWGNIQFDNAYDNEGYGTDAIVRATNIDVQGVVMNSTATKRSFFYYDAASKIGTIEKQSFNPIFVASNMYINDDNGATGTIFFANDDAQLAAVLEKINTNKDYWNTTEPVIVNLGANTFTGDHALMQYPDWNGVAGSLEYSSLTNYTNVKFVGTDDTVIAGNFVINGWGAAGNTNTWDKDKTTTEFVNVTFDGSNSTEDGNAIALYMTAAASNVKFEECTFLNSSHVNFGANGHNRTGNFTFNKCKFINGNNLSGYFNSVTVTDSTVINANKGFINEQGTGSVTVKGCTIDNAGEYFLRNNGNVKVVVEDTTIGAVADLIIFRGGNNTVTFTGCTLPAGYTVKYTNAAYADTTTLVINGAPLVTTSEALKDAIANGEKNVNVAQDMTITGSTLSGAADDLTVTLGADTTVTVTSGAAASKDITITGDKSSKVVLVNTNPGYEGKLSYQDGANLTFKGITFDANEISGICARGGVVTFIDCFITGELEQTIASKFVFSGCTFDVGVTQVGYGCPDVVFEGCTFETDGYGIKIYKEANENVVNLTVKDCSFKNTGSDARSAILLDHILDGFSYNITVENCTFEGYTATPTATYNKWAARMIVADSFVKTADGQYIFSYQTGAEGGAYHKILTADKLVVTVQ